MTHWTVIPAISAIQEAVCDHTGVTVAELVSGRRDRRVVVPRMTAMWLARSANYTFSQIGLAFGGRDQTTVNSAVRRIEKMMDEDVAFADLVDRIIRAIGPVLEPRRVPMPDPGDNALIAALRAIARGRADCGRPIGGEEARQLARTALTDHGIGWGINPNGGSLLLGSNPPVSPNA
jgi:hypothetical protein